MQPRFFSPYELAFLSSIHADPRDDAPRLIYADWLDENGEATYAEFIRLQCQAARQVGILSEYEYTAREKDLLTKFAVSRRAAKLKGIACFNCSLRCRRFHRGFPDVECHTTNYYSDDRGLKLPLECIAPHYQLTVLLDIYRTFPGDPVSMLGHPLFRRAQRIYVRAFSGYMRGKIAVPLADDVVAAAVETFRTRKLLSVRFGRISDQSKALIKAQLTPHVTTITPCR